MAHQHQTRLILARHAESVANAELRIQGWSDDPLSPRGEEQAQQLARWLHQHEPSVTMLVASPLQRSRQTANALAHAPGLEVHIREGIRELGLGKLENAHDSTFAQALAEGNIETRYQFEPLPNFVERTIGTLYGLVAVNDGNTILVVAHGGVIGVAMAYWLDRDISRAWEVYGATLNTSLSELVFTHDHVELARFNETPHLE
jgi:probable phosphoglycerate mutase